MTLDELSERNRMVLQVLRERKAASRGEISEYLKKLSADQVSSVLSRLDAFGFAEKSESAAGSCWMITQAGLALFGDPVPPPPESPPDSAEANEEDPPAFVVDYELPPEAVIDDDQPPATPDPMMEQMELDAAVDSVVARLRLPTIPAQSARVYRRLVAALPEAVRLALEPITAMVES